MNDKTPYVQTSVRTLEKMALLANGSNAAVFLTLALLEPAYPCGASEQVLANYTGKGLATVKTALANLLSNAMVETVTEGLYLTSDAFARWGKRQREDVGAFTPDAPSADFTGSPDRRTKKVFCTMNDDVQNKSTLENPNSKHSFMHENAPAQKSAELDSAKVSAKLDSAETQTDVSRVFEDAGIEGKNIERLAAKVSLATARLWATWLEHVDRKRWTCPEGYCYNRLMANPLAKPPYAKAPKSSAPRDENRPVVSGRLAQLVAKPQEVTLP